MDPLSISARLSAIESMASRGAWGEIRASLAPEAESEAMTRPELVALYGESLLRTGEPRAAHRWFAPRLSTLARAANRSATRRAVNLAGAAAFEIGEVPEAEQHFAEALQLAERDGDNLLIARATNNLALVASLRGERDTALAYYALAIPVYQRVGNARGLAETYHNMAITLREGGQLERAEECEREALEHARDTSNARLEAFIGVGRAELMLSRGDPAYAAFAAQRSADDFRRLGDPACEAGSLRLVGIALERLGERARAGATLTRAVAIAEHGGNALVAAECDVALARHVALTDPPRARALLVAAEGTFERLGARVKVEQVGRLLAQLGAPPSGTTR
jgi:ATP/maltotriose-dependent transcriptional regulator MalT